MKCTKEMMLVYAVSDSGMNKHMPFLDVVEAVLRNGATMFQLREKHLDEVMRLLNMTEYRQVGVMLCKITEDKAYYEVIRPAEFQELKNRGLSLDFITSDNQLSRYRYFLEEVWGIDG